MKRGLQITAGLALAAILAIGGRTAWQRGCPPRPALAWLQRLQPEEVTEIELVTTPQAPEECCRRMSTEESARAVRFLNTAQGRCLARPEPVAGRESTLHLTMQDGSRHTITNTGNVYLYIDEECYLPGYNWLSCWEELPGAAGDAPLPEDFVY